MQRKLDRTRAFGKISPPMEVAGYELSAHYEQDGGLFDAHDCECVMPGAAPQPEPVPVSEPVHVLAHETARGGDAVEAAPPADAADPAPVNPRKARAQKRALEQAQTAAPPPVPAPPPPANGIVDGVDLAAWGRGQKDYLFGEIRKAVRKGYHAQLTERRDVIDLLIAQRVIAAAEARKDV